MPVPNTHDNRAASYPTPLQQGIARHLQPSQQATLAKAIVGIAGCGGLGSNVAVMLTRSGVGTLVLADFDRVEPSNLNRQHYTPKHLGRLKVDALAEQLYELAPGITLHMVPRRLTMHTIPAAFAGCHVIVEALDNAQEKAMCYTALQATSAFYIGASGIGGWGKGPLTMRRVGKKAVFVGDFTTCADNTTPPMAPRVLWAAAMQADAALACLLPPTP